MSSETGSGFVMFVVLLYMHIYMYAPCYLYKIIGQKTCECNFYLFKAFDYIRNAVKLAKIPVFLHTCSTFYKLPSYISTMVCLMYIV